MVAIAETINNTMLAQADRERLEARFRDKTAPDRTTGCLNWTGAIAGGGYGQFGVGNKVLRAHRVAYWLAHGPIPFLGSFVRHLCRNRRVACQ